MAAPVASERWRSSTTFVLALAVATVGLGNLWRFAFLMGENGGAPFLLSYVGCLLLVGVPLLTAEVVLGAHGRGSVLLTLGWAAQVAGRSRLWLSIGVLACLAAFLMLIACILVGGWALAYAFYQHAGEFVAIDLDASAAFLRRRIDAPRELLLAQVATAALATGIVALGVRRGLGLFAWLTFPMLLTLLTFTVLYAVEHGDLIAAGRYLFNWQAIDFSATSFMVALSHAVFTLSVGVAVGMSYGAYAPEQLPILRAVLAVALFDIGVGVAAGLVVFPLLFAANLLPAQDFSLLFIGLPFAFGALPFGDVYGALFYLLVLIAVLGSSVALLEPVLGSLVGQFRVPRPVIALLLGVSAGLLSCLATVGLRGGGELLISLDAATSRWLMPAVMLLLALFVGWRIPPSILRLELAREPDILFTVWYFLLRFLAAPVIAAAWLWLALVH